MSDEQLRVDELVSAYLDGEASPAEITEIESSDPLLARVEEFRAVRDAVAEPVTSLPADRRNDLIGAALGVTDAEAGVSRKAKVVPFRRPQRLLLAMAAAVVLLAAVVGTGLITSRSDDATTDTAAPAPAEMATEPTAEAPSAIMAPAEEEPMADEESIARMDMETAAEAMDEEPMAQMDMAADAEAMAEAMDEEPMAQMDMAADAVAMAEEPMADEEPTAEAASAATSPVATTTTTAAAADDSREAPSEQVVDLGTFESLESLLDDVGASWSAALDDDAMADPGACAAEVHERALELSTDEPRSFVADVGTEDPVTFDGRFVRRDDGTAVVVYAAPPGCEVNTRELSGS